MRSSTGMVWRARPIRHIALASAVVLVVCLGIGLWSLASYRSTVGGLRLLTGRAEGTVVDARPDGAVVAWTAPMGRPLRMVVPMTGTVPAVGTRTQVAYDPGSPGDAVIPGAASLTEADRARDGVLFACLVGIAVVVVDGWLLGTRRRAALRAATEVSVRRVVLRRGLLARTWLEVTGPKPLWIPVHFEPDVLLLPAPVAVTVRGNAARDRLVVAELPGGGRLYPSGRVRRVEPPGRRTDSPSEPDSYARARADAAGRWRRQLRVDAALLVPAPPVGLLWAYLDDGGVTAWLGASVLVAAVALWWAAIRGSDPS
jgi:hypothetical protein